MKKGVKSAVKISMALLAFIVAVTFISLNYRDFKLNPLEPVALKNMSMVTASSSHDRFVVSDSNRKVTKFTSDRQMVYQLTGGSRSEDAFYLITEIATNESGELYLLENQLDSSGSYIEAEVIHHYDKNGKRLDSLFSLEDETESKLIPAIKGLDEIQGSLRWAVLSENDIKLYKEGQEEPVATLAFEHADQMVQDIQWQSDNSVIFITKSGFIFEQKLGGELKTLFSPTQASKASRVNLWSIGAIDQEHIYALDLGNFGVYALNSGTLNPYFRLVSEETNAPEVFFNFYIDDKQLLLVNDDHLIEVGSNKEVQTIDDLKLSSGLLVVRLLNYAALLALLVSLALMSKWMGSLILRFLRDGKMSITIPILMAVTTAAVLISYLVIQYYGAVIDEQAINALKMTVQTSEYVIDGDLVAKISDPTDYQNETYNQVADQLQKLIHYNEEPWNENLYTALYTIVDNRYYALVYNDNRITPYYPFNAFTNQSEYDYFLKAYEGEVTSGREIDADGQWIFAMGPVYDKSGNVRAIVEVGMNKYIFDEWNAKIIKQILIDIVSMIIILILLIAEITFLMRWLKDRRMHETYPEYVANFNRLSILRSLAVFIYIAIFMCTPFIPILAKHIYEPIGQLPMTVALGLPIFFEVLMTALSILLAGVIAQKYGWRRIFMIGALILVLAGIATAMTRSLVWFIAIRAFAGIGNGFIQMTMYAFINIGEDETQRNEAFAHMMSGAIAGTNLGFVLGANLADKIGYFNVFYMMAGFGIAAILFERLLLKNYPVLSSDMIKTEEVVPDPMPWWKFFLQPSVLVFFTLILVPAFLCYMYLEYYFPIFAESNGLPTALVGIVFSLYGLFIVYLGPWISTFSEKNFGAKNATVLASVLTGLSLLVFALTGSLAGAIFAVLVLALSDSFGETVYTTYFLGLKASGKIGKSIAAGYYEFVQQVGKMLGAVAFGVAIGFGAQLGIGFIGIVTLIMAVIFYFAYLGKAPR